MANQSCFCGCGHFKYKGDESSSDGQMAFYNICLNCNHTLAEHVKIRKQSE